MIKTLVLPISSPDALPRAIQVLRDGGVVAFPTDTVYGVGAHAFLPGAVEALYVVKDRPRSLAIPLLLATRGAVAAVARPIPAVARLLMGRFWPGGLTLVLRRRPVVPDIVTAGGDTVAVRLPDHPVPRSLAAGLGAPLAATSANLSGRPSATTAQAAAADLNGRVPLILDGGPCPGGVESTVVDVSGPEWRILREGAISARSIREFLEGCTEEITSCPSKVVLPKGLGL
jgi:L-threonylcarbamoyladenylate synthase